MTNRISDRQRKTTTNYVADHCSTLRCAAQSADTAPVITNARSTATTVTGIRSVVAAPRLQ